ncbi:hypothetical protein AM500_11415 [Bacillus sp. FJAT-18017]|uniref:hypothetical protein n=1 Tax=Bacillus sp. FJAT-18017 TaxID=1705566 RepID=UPI0006AE082F|nr:hypothetical protein [Bacillus sp. FJAT-18017]ALC90325.1 hypothetical protein AM500_11415 [Bacillus sp. FJAT-18017]
MTINTRFPFYDQILGLITPHLPMILNDLSGNYYEDEVEYEADFDEEYSEEFFDDVDLEDFGEETDEGNDILNFAISFERGNFPDNEVNQTGEPCDFEMIIKPFFTIKPYILIGLHNGKTQQFFSEIIDFPDYEPIDLLEKFAVMVRGLFKDESDYNKIFILSSMSHLAIKELISFDEPAYIKGKDGNVQYVSSPYFELDNPTVQEYLIKQKQ